MLRSLVNNVCNVRKLSVRVSIARCLKNPLPVAESRRIPQLVSNAALEVSFNKNTSTTLETNKPEKLQNILHLRGSSSSFLVASVHSLAFIKICGEKKKRERRKKKGKKKERKENKKNGTATISYSVRSANEINFFRAERA